MKIPADPADPKVSNGDGWEYEISDLQDSSTGGHLDLAQLLFPRFRPLQQRREIRRVPFMVIRTGRVRDWVLRKRLRSVRYDEFRATQKETKT